MELFGIGIFEVFLVMLIALLVLGPQDTIKTGRSLGKAVRRFFRSEEWRALLEASREIRTIPEKLLEDTGLDSPEDLLPSEAEFRKEAGLDDLVQNVAEWNADISKMKQEAGGDQPGQILPPDQEIRPPASSPATGARQARLDEVERDLSEWKADLSAWGNSPVIIPTPQASAPAAAQTPKVSEQAAASAEPVSPAQDQPESEPPAQETASSPSPEQEQQ
jgi:Sec-independent protein translocase protein TatA